MTWNLIRTERGDYGGKRWWGYALGVIRNARTGAISAEGIVKRRRDI
jgi:hypothetical protein